MTRMSMEKNSDRKTQLVVIGAGPGGYAAAFLAADLGMDVTVVDPEANPGGVCLYRGCIPSKALLHVAKLIRETGEAEEWGVSFGKPESADIDEKDWWTARAVRGKMLEHGVWAISDREETIRLYPALNMEESVLREGLQIMEDAIRHVEKHGHVEGDTAAFPSGVAGF